MKQKNIVIDEIYRIENSLIQKKIFLDDNNQPIFISNVQIEIATGLSKTEVTDVINELNADTGVTVDGVLLKDSEVSVNVINEKNNNTGVTVDGVLLKDSNVTTTEINGGSIALGNLIIDSTSNASKGLINFESALNIENAAAPSVNAEGNIFWDSIENAMTIQLGINNQNFRVGQHTLVKVKNTTGSTLLKGKSVFISGAQGSNVLVSLAKADSCATASSLGLITEDITNNSVGFVTNGGILLNINTNAFTVGDTLYLSATTAGELQNTAPAAPNFAIRIAVVLEVSVNAGNVFVTSPVEITDVASVENLRVIGTLTVDTINELNNTAGVTIDGVRLRDSNVTTEKVEAKTSNLNIIAKEFGIVKIGDTTNSNVLTVDRNNGRVEMNAYIQLNDVIAPGNPTDNQGRLYKKSGDPGLFWKPDSAGGEIDVTASAGWGLLGNAATNPATNFIGTSDATALAFRTNSVEKMRILSNGDIGIGIIPVEQLHITGNFRMPLTTATTGIVFSGADRIMHAFGGNTNLFLGSGAGNFTLSGAVGNNAHGEGSLSSLTSGDFNSGYGCQTLRDTTSGSSNLGFARQALVLNQTGSFNCALGELSMKFNIGGSFNCALGRSSLFNNTSGSNCTSLGDTSMGTNTTGTLNTCIGSGSDVGSAALVNACAIGSNSSVSASNKIQLGDANITVLECQVSLTVTSGMEFKENFLEVSGEETLSKLRNINVGSWNYIGDEDCHRHYGPVAEDMFDAFGEDKYGCCASRTTINTGDMSGLLMIAVKALEKRTNMISALEYRLSLLETKINK